LPSVVVHGHNGRVPAASAILMPTATSGGDMRTTSHSMALTTLFALGTSLAPLSAATSVFWQDFNNNPTGTYTTTLLNGDFPNCPWNQGVSRGYCSGVYTDSPRSLKITYPSGAYGPSVNGAQWPMPFSGNASYEELTVEMDIRFCAVSKL
jgi:hypothetical protein